MVEVIGEREAMGEWALFTFYRLKRFGREVVRDGFGSIADWVRDG